jgi:hypothetical protein
MGLKVRTPPYGAPVNEYRQCRYCAAVLLHRFEFGVWIGTKHLGPCGLDCLGGGVDAGSAAFHDNQCGKCIK